ncbi:PEP-CTERM/exosortase system-associated acyltransferase [Thiocystis violacea]|uniref:PEP-CTERM/exosortase system-associated acyltransferase n=1 Tax=Thiocystis violacea TaxID=13725 RepID=UPI0019049F95|nr:PEP-CTERM/exosortase system-associated acyltransferase [Thiocystis violacea]
MVATTVTPGLEHAKSVPGRHFSFSRADREEDIASTYRIRYQVYCLERGFLDASHYPEGLERDAFDAHAVPILARHEQGEPAGTARLVMPSALGFPLEGHCRFSPGREVPSDTTGPFPARYVEISRLAVSRAFRRRKGDGLYGGPPRPGSPQAGGAEILAFPTSQQTPEIVSGIYRLLYQESRRRGVEHWVVAMERGLDIILRRMGLDFTPIGPRIDYFGPVRPYLASIETLERHLYRTAPEVLRFMLTGLEPELWPAFARDRGDSWGDLASIG